MTRDWVGRHHSAGSRLERSTGACWRQLCAHGGCRVRFRAADGVEVAHRPASRHPAGDAPRATEALRRRRCAGAAGACALCRGPGAARFQRVLSGGNFVIRLPYECEDLAQSLQAVSTLQSPCL